MPHILAGVTLPPKKNFYHAPLKLYNVRHTVNFVQFHIKFVKWQTHDLILMVNMTLVISSFPHSPHSLLSSFSLPCLSSPKKHLDLIWNFCCGYEILFAESGLSSPFSFCHTSENVFPVKFNPKLVSLMDGTTWKFDPQPLNFVPKYACLLSVLSSLSLIDGFTYIWFVQGRCASTIKLLVYHLSNEISIHAFVVVFTVMNRFLLELDYTRVSTEHWPILGLAVARLEICQTGLSFTYLIQSVQKWSGHVLVVRQHHIGTRMARAGQNGVYGLGWWRRWWRR